MADKFVIAAGGNWSASGTWSLTDGGAGGAGVPSASDNACMSNLSGNLVQDQVGAVCLDLDQTRGTGYTGTFSGSQTLTVSGSIKRKGTWTYSGAMTANATATGKTIQNNGVAWSASQSLTFNGSGGGWTLSDAMTGSPAITLLQGALDFSTFTHSIASFTPSGASTRSLAGSGTINITATAASWNASGSGFTSTFSGTVNMPTGTVTFNGNGVDYSAMALVMVNSNGGALQTLSGNNSFRSLSWTVTGAVKTSTFSLSGNQVVGALTLNGFDVLNRGFLVSSVTGTSRTITITGPTSPTISNFDFMDINAAGGSPTAPWTGTSLGDCGGNTGITMTPAATQTATGTASFSWSTHGWTTRVPLPQDDVVVNNAFVAGRTITIDMPRIGKSIDFSGCTGTPTVTRAAVFSFFGSWKLAAGMSNTGASAATAGGRSNYVIQSNGVAGAGTQNINAPSGVYTLSDALTVTNNNVVVQMGTLVDAGFTVSCFNAQVNSGGGSLTKTGNWVLAGLSWTMTGTITDTAGFIKFTDATASTKVFTGGAQTYNDLWMSGAGTGVYQIVGSNTFGTFRGDTGRNIQFTAGTSTTATTWSIDGCTIGSITASNHTLVKAGGGKVKAQGVTVSRSTASPAFTFYDYGVGATDGGNNVNWNFYNPDYSLALDPLSFQLSLRNSNILAGRRLVFQSLLFSFSMRPATVLAQRRVGLDPLAFSLTLGSIRLADLYRDPRYTISASPRNRSIGGNRTRTIYKRD